MHRKKRKCPHFSRVKDGKWIKMACSLPARDRCPDPRCLVNPDPVDEDLEIHGDEV